MKKSRFPESLVLIFAMIVIAQVATLVLPRGEFQREGRSVVPGTYQRLVDGEGDERAAGSAAVGVLRIVPDALLAIPRGMEAGADIIFFVFLIGGVIGVIRKTGAIDAVLGAAIHRLGGRPGWLVLGMLTEDIRFTKGRIAVLASAVAALALFVWGTKVHDWYLRELAALFLGLGLLAATR